MMDHGNSGHGNGAPSDITIYIYRRHIHQISTSINARIDHRLFCIQPISWVSARVARRIWPVQVYPAALQNTPHITGTVKPVFRGHLETVKPVFRKLLYIQGKVSLHDRCPFFTGSETWGRQDTVLRKSPDQRVSFQWSVHEDRFYCNRVKKHREFLCPLRSLLIHRDITHISGCQHWDHSCPIHPALCNYGASSPP